MPVSRAGINLGKLYADPISWIRHCKSGVCQIRRLLNKAQSVAALETFLFAMTLNPDVYQKAQKVIDEQIGDRLIEPSDRESLPYITCLLKEVLRCVHPIVDNNPADPFFG